MLIAPEAHRETYLSHQGIQIYTQTYGDPENPAVLFTHGAFQCSQCWSQEMLEDLSRDWFVIIWDMPGHGFSGPYGPESLKQASQEDIHTSALAAVIDAFDLRARGFVQVAWSIAGLITRNYLFHSGTQGVRGILLIGSSLDLPALVGGMSEDALQRSACIAAEKVEDRVRQLPLFLQSLSSHPFCVADYQRLLAYNLLAALRPLPFVLSEGDIRSLLEQHPIPILAIHGIDDALFDHQALMELNGSFPQTIVCEYKTGHSPFVEDPGRFLFDIHTFLNRVYDIPALKQVSSQHHCRISE